MLYVEFKKIVERPRRHSLAQLRDALEFANTKFKEADQEAETEKLKAIYSEMIETLEAEIARSEDMKEPDAQL